MSDSDVLFQRANADPLSSSLLCHPRQADISPANFGFVELRVFLQIRVDVLSTLAYQQNLIMMNVFAWCIVVQTHTVLQDKE